MGIRFIWNRIEEGPMGVVLAALGTGMGVAGTAMWRSLRGIQKGSEEWWGIEYPIRFQYC
jgi:hypothetical protein